MDEIIRVSAKITAAEREQLWEEAEKQGATLSDMAGVAISKWLKVQKSAAKFKK